MNARSRTSRAKWFPNISLIVLLLVLAGCQAAESRKLHYSIMKKDSAKVLSLIERGGVDINKRDPDYQQTPLYCAASTGQSKIVKALLDAGGDLHIEEEKHGRVPLHAAALNGHTIVAKLLIESGADVNVREDDGNTPLINAAGHGHIGVVDVLFENGAEVDAQNEKGTSALSFSAYQGHLGIVKTLLSNGAEANIKTKNDITPLMNAAAAKHCDIVRFLIQNGAQVDVNSGSGWTALMFAARAGDVSCVTALVEGNANLNIQCKDREWTALHFASYKDNTAAADYLIDAGASAICVGETEEDLYATAVSSKLFAGHYEQHGDKQTSIQYYQTAGEYYEKASTSYKQHAKELGGKITSTKLANFARFVGEFAGAVAIGVAAGGHVITTPSGSGTSTTSMSELKKECQRKHKLCLDCSKACQVIVECFQSSTSKPDAEKRIKDARKCLGFL